MIEQICKRFIWGLSETEQGIPLVKWDWVCTPQKAGRLDFHRLEWSNDTFIMKLVLHFLTYSSKIWVRVMLAKYGVVNVYELSVFKM